MSVERRDFLRILGIGGAAAGLTGCSRTAPDTLTPYVTPPEEIVRGHAVWYRTTCRECPAGCGLEARVREGRVHKVEGAPEHPVSGGGLCARGQAAVQGLYNPDRLRTPLVRNRGKLEPASWDEALQRAAAGLEGKPVTVVTGCLTGALAELARGLGRHVQYEPVNYATLRDANAVCFGLAALPTLRFADAKTILLFGADVIETFISPVGYARGIAEARNAGARMIYVGPRLSLTGARADEWIPVAPGVEDLLAAALAGDAVSVPGVSAETIARLKRELAAGPSIAAAGGASSLYTAIAVNRLNAATGALNRTVRFDRVSALGAAGDLSNLSDAVIVANANPAYNAPNALRRTPFLLALASWPDETTDLAHVVLPIHTPLESWGDYEPWTGVVCLQQPAMRPVFDTRDLGDVLLALSKTRPAPTVRELLRARWSEADFQRGLALRDAPEVKAALRPVPNLAPPETAPYTLQTYPSIAHFDGRGANRPWLQELPDPVTQVVWDSWVELNPQDAARLGVSTGDRVSVRSPRGAVEAAAYVYPGIVGGAAAMPLGQGHTAFGRYATGVGVNAAALAGPVEIELVRKARDLAIVAGHDYQEGRKIIRSSEDERHEHPHISLYPEHAHPQHRWAMAVDLDRCNGCSACVTACYAENNIPLNGKEEVARGRHMSWLRIERFFGAGGGPAQPLRVDFAPMMCQHCDHAPCEPVCPVYASVHNSEGLNSQVYNRCVGTRYCANNCPYKQRRFNWFPAEFPEPLNWQLNPDVTVRSKGVMEKCTFCVQRITAARDRARREGRPMADGDVTPACAQSCPAGAIVFGDLNDRSSRIARALESPRRYTILEELNTRPAVHYLHRERRA